MNRIPARISALLLALCLLLLSGSALAAEPPLPDVALPDQYGNVHRLSDYQGKIVFLNFWATWCPPCIDEMPEFESLYHELGENREDVVILGVAAPDPANENELDEAGIAAFLEQQGITYPVLMDGEFSLWSAYPCPYVPHSHFFLPDGTPAQVLLPDSMVQGLGVKAGTRDSMIVGGIDKAYFETALEEIRASLSQE